MSQYEHDYRSHCTRDYDIRSPADGVQAAVRARAPLAALLAVSVGAMLALGSRGAAAGVVIDVGVPPPPARVVVAPAPRPGFIWASGYWYWNGRAHAWHDGYWVHERPGWRWAPEAWVMRHGHYHFVRGHWAR